MATRQKHSNNGTSTLLGAFNIGATSCSVQAGHGARFPSPAAGEYFLFTLKDAAGNIEICKCTQRTTDTFNVVVRAQEGTTERNWLAGDLLEARLTRDTMDRYPQKDADETISGAWTFSNALTISGNNVFAGIQTFNSATPFVFEGATADSFETMFAVEDPTGSDKTITVPNRTGKIQLDTTPGQVVQVVYTEIRTQVGPLTNTTPYDSSVPQVTEGSQVLVSNSITPTSATNYLLITVNMMVFNTTSDVVTMHLHRDSGANALASIGNHIPIQAQIMTLVLRTNADDINARTYQVRMGPGSGGSTYVNGDGSAKYANTAIASITITEIAA